MYNVRSDRVVSGGAPAAGGTLTELVADTANILFRRRWVSFWAPTIVAIGLGFGYLLVTPAKFTSEATLLIDPKQATPAVVSATDGPNTSDPIGDAVFLENQLEIIKSPNVLGPLVKKFDLDKDPEFDDELQSARGGFSLTRLLSSIVHRAKGPVSDDERTMIVVNNLGKVVSVRRVGQSQLVKIEVTTESGDKSARLANGIAASYIEQFFESRLQSMKRSTEWLETRLKDLRENALSADRAVQVFKIENNLLEANGNGRTLTDQQISERNSQLAAARGDVALAKARLERIQQIMSGNRLTEANDDTLKNENLTRLRQQYGDASKRYEELSQRYGPDHVISVTALREQKVLESQIRDELGRIADTQRSEYEIAKGREAALVKDLEREAENASSQRMAEVQLRALESTAESYRALYDTFLQRYIQNIQQQSQPVGGTATVLTEAVPPLRKSWPKGSVVLALAAAMGAAAGAMVALAREGLDRAIRTVGQLEQASGTRCISLVPHLHRRRGGRMGIISSIVDHPMSAQAEAIRRLKLASDQSKRYPDQCAVLGAVSALPGEGKTTVAGSIAFLAAQSGLRVLVIDADMRNPALTRMLKPGLSSGLPDLLKTYDRLGNDANGPRQGIAIQAMQETQGAVWLDPKSSLTAILAPSARPAIDTSGIVSSPTFARLVGELRSSFDLIVVDLPPLAPVVDAQAAAGVIDQFILVTAWQKTAESVLRHALSAAPDVAAKLVGCVLNNVVLQRYGQYDYAGHVYYSSSYSGPYHKGSPPAVASGGQK